jgi:hypothetical protein
MQTAIRKWVIILIALFLAGPLAYALTSGVVGVDGGPQATALVGASIPMGLARTLAAMVIVCVVGVVGARLTTARSGLFCAGLTAIWAAGGSGTVIGVLRATTDQQTLISLSIESAILAVTGGVVIFMICRAGRAASEEQSQRALSPESGYAIAAALLAGGLAAWFVAQESTKGQSLAAAAAAAAIGVTVARVVALESSMWVVATAPMLLGVIGPVAALVIHKDQTLDYAFANQMLTLAKVAPLDWFAGALIGAPIGMSWAGSLVHKRLEQAEAAPTA